MNKYVIIAISEKNNKRNAEIFSRNDFTDAKRVFNARRALLEVARMVDTDNEREFYCYMFHGKDLILNNTSKEGPLCVR